MQKNLFKQHKDFFLLGMDFNENGFQGLLGDFIQQAAHNSLEFATNVRPDTKTRGQLVYLKDLPALLKQVPDLIYGYFNQFGAVVACEFERDKQSTYSLLVTSWEEFIDQFGKTQSDKAELIKLMNKTKKTSGFC